MSISECLEKPLTSALTKEEEKLTTRLVKRKLNTSTDKGTVRCQTGGQPLILKRLRKPRKETKQASRRTVKRRVNDLDEFRRDISGNNTTSVQLQLSSELKGLSQDTRSKVCEGAGVTVSGQIDSFEGVQLKSVVGLSWNQIRKLKHVLARSGIRFRCEQKQRKLTNEILNNHFVVEEIDVIVQDPTNKTNLSEKRKPFGRVRSIVSFVLDILNKYKQLNLLVSKEGIPRDEIWIKIGGDHGGGSFKLCLQILNLLHPNSKKNTFVIGLIEVKDTCENLKRLIGPTSHIQEEIRQLEDLVWDNKQIRVFLSGDYDFLCKTYGLSGAQGVRPCLWCTILKEKIKSGDGPAQERTLSNLKADFHRFETLGQGKKSNAKHFNNVCSQPVWNIELSRVCPPYLHILLGITQKHHVLLEKFCHEIDIAIAKDLAKKRKKTDRSTKFGAYVHQLQEIRALRIEEKEIKDSLGTSDPAYCRKAKEVLKAVENRLAKLKKESFLEERTGPIAANLDKVLNKHKITLQAYHGRSFVGNHAHRYFQVNTIEDICKNVSSVCKENTNNIQIVQRADRISKAFQNLNKLYAKVHSKVSHDNYIPKDDINSCERAINKYMKYFRSTFPDESVTPKQHMLDHHILPWISQWQCGLSLHGEQGIEQTHASVNALKGRVTGVRNDNMRLIVLLKEQYMSVAPHLKLRVK